MIENEDGLIVTGEELNSIPPELRDRLIREGCAYEGCKNPVVIVLTEPDNEPTEDGIPAVTMVILCREHALLYEASRRAN
jgi:hypothetical protein